MVTCDRCRDYIVRVYFDDEKPSMQWGNMTRAKAISTVEYYKKNDRATQIHYEKSDHDEKLVFFRTDNGWKKLVEEAAL